MTTSSNAFYARALKQVLEQRHPKLKIAKCKGTTIGAGSQRVIHIKLECGKFAQFPFPMKGTHTRDVIDRLYGSACSMLRLDPSDKPFTLNV